MVRIAGVPVERSDAHWLVDQLEHDDSQDATSAAVALAGALRRGVRATVTISFGEGQAILAALTHAPPGLARLRDRLVRDHYLGSRRP